MLTVAVGMVTIAIDDGMGAKCWRWLRGGYQGDRGRYVGKVLAVAVGVVTMVIDNSMGAKCWRWLWGWLSWLSTTVWGQSVNGGCEGGYHGDRRLRGDFYFLILEFLSKAFFTDYRVAIKKLMHSAFLSNEA